MQKPFNQSITNSRSYAIESPAIQTPVNQSNTFSSSFPANRTLANRRYTVVPPSPAKQTSANRSIKRQSPNIKVTSSTQLYTCSSSNIGSSEESVSGYGKSVAESYVKSDYSSSCTLSTESKLSN